MYTLAPLLASPKVGSGSHHAVGEQTQLLNSLSCGVGAHLSLVKRSSPNSKETCSLHCSQLNSTTMMLQVVKLLVIVLGLLKAGKEEGLHELYLNWITESN
jgi:hypothetical protein